MTSDSQPYHNMQDLVANPLTKRMACLVKNSNSSKLELKLLAEYLLRNLPEIALLATN